MKWSEIILKSEPFLQFDYKNIKGCSMGELDSFKHKGEKVILLL